MLEFRQSMDPNSILIIREGNRVGYIQTHADREQRLLITGEAELTRDELRQCHEQFLEDELSELTKMEAHNIRDFLVAIARTRDLDKAHKLATICLGRHFGVSPQEIDERSPWRLPRVTPV